MIAKHMIQETEKPRSWNHFEDPPRGKNFYIGVDFGMMSDYTAICVVEDAGIEKSEAYDEEGKFHVIEKQMYHMVSLERPPLMTSYRTVVDRIEKIIGKLEKKKNSVTTIVDKTGVGGGVVELFYERGLSPIEVTVTGGMVQHGFHVPKRDLVVSLQVLFQDKRLKIARKLELGDTLIKELKNFRVKINVATGHDSYEAWREGDHDDLVFAASLVAWYAERMRPPEVTIRNPFWPPLPREEGLKI